MAKFSHIAKFCLSENLNIDIQEEVPQHVINGVRFLYKQFVKHKPGVILNDPASYNQETQVSMFLNGIHKSLEQHHQILILCDTDRVSVWSDCLMKWMPDFDKVAIDWPKPTSKKSVYVATTDRLECYYRRDWTVVVVDDDSFLQYKLAGTNFKVGYKIFITADDLKENLQKFSQIYRWLYPDQRLNIDDFRPNRNSISDILQKRIWFGAFVQDILIRNARSLVQISANTYQAAETLPQPERRRITRKNKDATGTKIKRSKIKLEEENTNTEYKKIVSTCVYGEENSYINIHDSKLDVSNNGDDQSNLDVEIFIRDQEPLKMEEYNISDIDDNTSHTSENMDVTEAKTEIDVSDNENSNGMKLFYSEDVTVNSDDAYYLETQDNGLNNDDLKLKENAISDFALVKDKVFNDNGVDNDNLKFKENEASDSIAVIKDEVFNTDENVDDLALCSKVKDDLIDGKLDSVEAHNGNEIQSKDKGNTDIKVNIKKEAKADDLDSKWEEMALKKFKGSLLDRLF